MELTTTDCYVLRIRTPAFLLFLKPSSLFVWLHYLLIPPSPSRCDHSPSHTQTHRLQRLAQRTHIRRQAKRLQRPSSVPSLYSDDRNTGTGQTPKVSSAIAEIYHCRILAELTIVIR